MGHKIDRVAGQGSGWQMAGQALGTFSRAVYTLHVKIERTSKSQIYNQLNQSENNTKILLLGTLTTLS